LVESGEKIGALGSANADQVAISAPVSSVEEISTDNDSAAEAEAQAVAAKAAAIEAAEEA
jgi:hypothetical protein